MKKMNTIRIALATAMLMCAMVFAFMCEVKVDAATNAEISFVENETGGLDIVAQSENYPVAIRVITSITHEASGWTITPGIYYFGEDHKLADITTPTSAYYVDNGTGTYALKVISAGTVTSDPVNLTVSSKAALFNGTLKSKVYYKGALFNGQFWDGSKVSLYKNGVYSSLKSGFVGHVYNGSTYVLDTVDWYLKNGVKTTIVYSKKSGSKYITKYYNGGEFAATFTGWKKIGTKIYYFKKGIACTGWNYLKSYGQGKKVYKYLFNSKGVLYTDLIKYYGRNSFINKKVKLLVNKTTHNLTFYLQATDWQGKASDKWCIPAKTIVCATARKKSDTPNGKHRLDKAITKRWFIYKDTGNEPWRYYQWAVKIWGIPSLVHSSTYWSANANSLRANLYNKLGTSCTTHCVRIQAYYAKIVYDLATKHRSTLTPCEVIESSNEGPFGHVSLTKISTKAKWDPTDPNKK